MQLPLLEGCNSFGVFFLHPNLLPERIPWARPFVIIICFFLLYSQQHFLFVWEMQEEKPEASGFWMRPSWYGTKCAFERCWKGAGIVSKQELAWQWQRPGVCRAPISSASSWDWDSPWAAGQSCLMLSHTDWQSLFSTRRDHSPPNTFSFSLSPLTSNSTPVLAFLVFELYFSASLFLQKWDFTSAGGCWGRQVRDICHLWAGWNGEGTQTPTDPRAKNFQVTLSTEVQPLCPTCAKISQTIPPGNVGQSASSITHSNSWEPENSSKPGRF